VLNGTRLNLNSGIDASGDFSTSYHTNVSALFRGYQVLIAPNNDYGQTRIHFPNRPVTEGFSEFGSGVRHKFDGSDARNSFLSLYTSNVSNLQIDAISINSSGNVGIRDTTPSYTLDVNGTFNASGNSLIGGTLGVTGAATLSSTLAVTDAVTLSTTSATPTSLLGKDGSNVVGTVTTLAQTGLMKAGGVTQNTSSVGIISVAHGLSYEPSQVIATLAQQNSYIVVCHDITASDLFFTVYDSVTGNPLNNISVGIFWLAIK
jgi:hypothetical protein